ncbi:unnamed protein product [Closterium sp. Naga37s-1]|nr:unnamed protein product [Closterium sp. Naga37s-1]
MIHWPLLADSSPLPLPVPFACPLWPPAPALLPAPVFRPPFCPLGDFLLTRTASPAILPALPPVPTVASAARAPPAPPICPSRATAASLAMVTRRPGAPSKCAASDALVIAAPPRTSPSACDVHQASGTSCCLSAPSASSGLASARCCCAPLAADRAVSATQVPPLAPCRRASAVVLTNARRHRSTLPVPGARRAGGTRPRAILRGAAPSPASETSPLSPYGADSVPAPLDRSSLAPLAPAVWSSPRDVPPRGDSLARAIPTAGPLTLRPRPGSDFH